MSRLAVTFSVLSALSLVACGDDATATESATQGTTATSAGPTTATSAGPTTGTTPTTGDSDSGTASQTGTGTPTTTEGTSTTTGTCTSITQDGDGNVWVGGVAFQDNEIRLIKVDPDTMQTIGMITAADIPELGNSWGLATDVEGYLWAVEMGTQAFKIDRNDYSYQVFQNTTSMYTYSDMTGFGLKNVAPQ